MPEFATFAEIELNFQNVGKPTSNPRQKSQVAVVSNWPEIGQYCSFFASNCEPSLSVISHWFSRGPAVAQVPLLDRMRRDAFRDVRRKAKERGTCSSIRISERSLRNFFPMKYCELSLFIWISAIFCARIKNMLQTALSNCCNSGERSTLPIFFVLIREIYPVR